MLRLFAPPHWGQSPPRAGVTVHYSANITGLYPGKETMTIAPGRVPIVFALQISTALGGLLE